MTDLDFAIDHFGGYIDGHGYRALLALREKAERMSGCDFCLDPDGDNCDNNIYIDHTHRAAITTHDVYVPINFCPMCGRKLKEG